MIDKFHHTVAVHKVVYSYSLCKHVFANASHLDCICGEQSASINECWSLKGHRVISFVHHQHPDKSLIAVYDEITTKFEAVFMLFS